MNLLSTPTILITTLVVFGSSHIAIAQNRSGIDQNTKAKPQESRKALNMLAKDHEFNDFIYAGVYWVDIVDNPKDTLSCRVEPSLKSPEKLKYKQGAKLVAVEIANPKKPWFKTTDGCYVRASSGFLKWAGKGEDPSMMCDWRVEKC